MTDFVEVTTFDPLIMKAPKGDKGDPGPANSLTIGTVTQGTAAATITGTAPNQVLNLVLQKGEKGDKGDPGTGDVSTVNGIQPDGTGNVQLNASDVGAASTADLASKADLVGGVVPTSQIPAIALETRVAVADQAAMLALTSSQVQPGDVAVRGDGAGTFMLMDSDPSVLSNWALLNAPADAVSSVNGQTGTVVLGASDVSAVPTTRTVNSKPLSADVVLAASDMGAATSAQGALADSAVQPTDLAAVATTGAYNDLTGKPTIPSTAADVGAVANAAGQTLTLWTGTQAQYDAIGTKDASTVYVVAG